MDVEARLDRAAAAAAAKEVTALFDGVGRGINKGLSGALSEGLKSFNTAGSRAQIELLQNKLVEASQAETLLAQKAEAASVRSVASWRAAEAAVDKYGAASARAMKATAGAIDASAMATAATNKHAKSVDDSKSAHDDLAAAVAGSTGAITRFHQAATIASTAVVGGFVAAAVDATKAAGDFQVQLVRLETVGGELPQNLKTIHDGLMNLASDTGWHPTELATGMLKVEQAGYRGTEALTVMKAAAQGAAEEGVGLDEAANAVTTTLGDYHLKADQAANVTSKMMEAVRLSKTTFAEFTSALHNVEPTAAGVGESLSDLLATLGMLTKSGMHADQASDNLNHALSSLGNIQPKQREMLAAVGLDPRQIPQDIRSKGYIGTAQEIRGAVDRRLGPNGNVILDAFENNPASQALEHEQYGRLSPAERAVADRVMRGQISAKDVYRERAGLGPTEFKILQTWLTTHVNNQGFNRVLKSLNTDQLGVMQALQTAVGGQDNARTLLQVTDQNNPEALQHREEIAAAHADSNGDVLEWNRSQQNFNAQWKDFKASVDALKIEFGEDFLPTATEWVKSLETGVHWMQQHRALVKDLIEDATALSGLFLGMKLSNALIGTVKQFNSNLGLAKKSADQVNTSLRESGPAAQAGAAGVKAASTEETTAQSHVKTAVYQANQELRQSGNAARQGASGVESAAAEEVGAEQRVRTAAEEANVQLRGAGAAAEAGAAGVTAAANTEIGAMKRVMGAANRAKGALALVGGMAASMGGDALQANTRENTNPHKLGVIASDAGNMAMAGAAVGSVIPGVGTALGGGIGALFGGGYAVWDQYFSGDHDVAAPDNPNPDLGPVPVVPDTSQPTPDTSQPTPDLTSPTPESQPETPDTPYAGGGDGGAGGKKKKDQDPLDEDLKRFEHLQTEANEIQRRIADDRNSNDPSRTAEIPWLQKKLDEINKELSGIRGEGKRGSGGSSPFMPVKLDDNWLQGGMPSLVRNSIGFLEDLVLGPLEVAAFHGIPDFAGAGGKGSMHSRRGGVRRSHEEGLGAQGPDALLGGIPGVRGAGSGVVPVFVTNWASGGPGGPRGGGASGIGSGAGSGYFAGDASGSGGGSFSGGSGGSGLGGSSPAAPIDLNGPLTADQIRSLSPDQQKQLLLNAFHPGAAVSGSGYPGVTVGTEPAHDPRSVARYIYSAAIARGYTPDQATQLVAYSVGESGLNPGISGGVQGDDEVIGLFQEKTAFARGHNRRSVVGNVQAYLDALETNRNKAWGAAYGVGHGALASTSVGGPLSYEGAQAWGPLMERARAYLGTPPPSPSVPAVPSSGPAAHNFYKDWYPRSAPTDADSLPPELQAFARQHGLDANGNATVDEQRAMLRQAFTRPPNRPGEGVPDSAPLPPVNPRTGRRFGDMDTRHSAQPTPQRPREDQGFWIGGGTGHLNVPKVMDNLNPVYWATGGLVKYFATGGPSGTDTIPAWLTPGEFVMNADATRQYLPYLQSMNKGARFSTGGLVPPQYWAPGTDNPVQPSPAAPAPQPQGQGQLPNVKNPGTEKPQGSGQSMRASVPGGPQPTAPGIPGSTPTGPQPTGVGAATPGERKGMSDIATPGADVQQPGATLPASPGIGFSGGLIGAAEGAAEGGASGLNMLAPGAGSAASAAMQIGFQELNRAASYGAQVGGILMKGLGETFTVSSNSTGGDWSKTIPGRLLSGIAGVRPAGQNTAGQTQQPLGAGQGGGYANTGDTNFHIHGPVNINAADPKTFYERMEAQFNERYNQASYAIPSGSLTGMRN
ncbi:hypothetical protein MINTM021_17530 [Mycobacterium paraintracellulare]|nr:hypothetical protein MINTM021_17530 [Mycobacterium paraintracellulare]